MTNEFESVIKIENLSKKYKGFELNIQNMGIPKGLATALIGENGAGKSTLLSIIAGTRLSYDGKVTCFDGKYADDVKREKMGYVSANNYFLPSWTLQQVSKGCSLLYDGFDKKRFAEWCERIGVKEPEGKGKDKMIARMSDGMQMKVMLASVFARDTDCLVLDEPASPLDPLMRDYLNSMIREYLESREGETSVFFSTHNISDMESVTDYAIIMERGSVVEEGFVDDLKEKYVLVKGDAEDIEKAEPHMFSITKSKYGFEGLCLADNIDKLAGINIVTEVPSLSQISVAVMKKYTVLSEE